VANSFLNLDDDDKPETDIKIGAGLKSKPKASRTKPDKDAVAKAGEAHGFTRSTEPAAVSTIYISSDLRNQLNDLRDKEGRRLNDVLADMLQAYQKN